MDKPMEVTSVRLEGRRALLVPMELEHTHALYEAGNYEEIWRYIPSVMCSEEDMRSIVIKALASQRDGHEAPFTIIDRENGRIVGSTRFYEINRAHRGLEIGSTFLSPSLWRTSMNTECKFLLLQYCFETAGAIRVALRADARNERSLRAIERIGAKREGVLRHHRIMPDGYRRDSVYFSILAEEWPAVKQKLTEYLDR